MMPTLLLLLALFLPQQAPAPAPRQQEDPAVTALALKLYAQARTGKLDPTLLSAERHTKGTLYTYQVTFPTAQFHIKLFLHPDGKFAGYGLDP
jgi:hypothetical protein